MRWRERERERERESREQFVCIKVSPFGLGAKAVYERETDREILYHVLGIVSLPPPPGISVPANRPTSLETTV